MEKVTISELKNRLSEYLRKVRAGQSVLILDRDRPIARLERVAAGAPHDDKLARLERAGLLRRAKAAPRLKELRARAPKAAPAIACREREGALGLPQAADALERLGLLAAAWQEVLPSEAVRGTAQRLLRVHPLRAPDSLQLAAALVAAERDPASLPFVSLDERLNEAASREGFAIVRG